MRYKYPVTLPTVVDYSSTIFVQNNNSLGLVRWTLYERLQLEYFSISIMIIEEGKQWIKSAGSAAPTFAKDWTVNLDSWLSRASDTA